MTTLIRCAALLVLASACLISTVHSAHGQNVSQSESTRDSPNEVLRSARSILIRTKSVYFKPSTLENALLQREEFQQWDLAITRDEADADLIIEVGRKLFTTSFIYSVIDPHTSRVVASGRVNSIGGTVEGKIADSFTKRMRLARMGAPVAGAK